MLQKHALAVAVALLATAQPGLAQKYSTQKNSGVIGIWISPEEIMALPTSGPAWEKLKKLADSDFGKAKGGHNDNHDVYTYGQALVAVRLNDDTYRAKVAANVISAIGSEDNGNVLSLARNLIGYVIAADLIDLKNFDPAKDAQFREWLAMVRHKELGGQGTLITIHEKRPNNFGTHATAARAAAAIYLGDQADLERTAQVFKGWMGDRSSYAGFKYGDLSWQADPNNPVGINPVGATKQGRNIDGVLPDDQRRGGKFKWPPPKENYVYGALQGALAAANILHRAGYDAFNWENRALLRAYNWLHNVANFSPVGDDRWQLPMVDYIYGTNFWDGSLVKVGKNMGWTDWTHGERGTATPITAIRGSVRNSQTNSGVENATVQLRQDAQVKYETNTNSQGQYSFNFIAAGTYEVTASRNGFEASSASVTVAEGQEVTVDLVLNPVQDNEPPAPPRNPRVVEGND